MGDIPINERMYCSGRCGNCPVAFLWPYPITDSWRISLASSQHTTTLTTFCWSNVFEILGGRECFGQSKSRSSEYFSWWRKQDGFTCQNRSDPCKSLHLKLYFQSHVHTEYCNVTSFIRTRYTLFKNYIQLVRIAEINCLNDCSHNLSRLFHR